ncbi:MAG: GNAT family N-acetyltransferase [Bdellovibrionales bacterium]|nr:GNAT family N-acetyltransferase [Bdellovibrionales bacterium]
MNVQIRRLAENDLPEVGELSRQLGYPIPQEKLKKQFDDLKNHVEHFMAVAEVSDATAKRVAGFIHANKYLDLIEPHTVQIIALVVDENTRSLGLGAKLVRAVEEWTPSMNVKEIWVRSNIKRERAHEFYKRLGYPIVKTSHKFSKFV